ncbi:MAG: HAMP domain-containing protein [Candidatus Tectomicrobia bacterium]|nr:HAMP domain-containing protein [Candidatus Tectomicrobia bacterium]
MPPRPQTGKLRFYRSIIFKFILCFLLILLVTVAPLALRYYQDSRAYEMKVLASKLEFFAERGAAWLDVAAITTLRRPEDKQAPAYRRLLATLNRIKQEFGVDNAIILRRQPDGRFHYVAAEHDGFAIGQPAHIHDLFPATYAATNSAWLKGEMMHSRLFGGRVGEQVFDQFVQVNTPLKLDGEVAAVLMLNQFANPVARAVRMKTARLVGLSVGILLAGLALFGVFAVRMFRPLKELTKAATAVAEGNLQVTLPPPRSRDEVGSLTQTFSHMLEGLRERDVCRYAFGRYVAQEVVEEALHSPEGLKVGGEARQITMLVSDLRGFTSLAQRLTPHEVLDILNRYLERMVAVIMRYRGTVDDFQGDGILAYFGTPLAAEDDPPRAVACAIEMQIELGRFNEEQRRRGMLELQMGIGLNSGEVIVGNIGSPERMKYSAVGTAINLAFRIESSTLGGQVFIGSSTYERVCSLVQVRSVREVNVKGIDRPLTLYEVQGVGGSYQLTLPASEAEAFLPLDPPLPVVCAPLDGKIVSEARIAGSMTHLTTTMAELCLETALSMHANLKVTLQPRPGAPRGDLYAKVLARQDEDPTAPCATVRVAFTSVSEAARASLEELRLAAGSAAAGRGE